MFGVLGALDLRAGRRAQSRHRGHLHRRRHGGLARRLSRGWTCGPACSSRRSSGAAFGLVHALLTVPLGLSQHVTGIGVTLLATSLSYFIYRVALPNVATPPRIEPFQPVNMPGLSDLPFIGPALFQQTPLTFLALALFAARGLRPLPHAARPRAPRRRREPGGRRGAGPRRACASASAPSWPARP